MSAATFVHLGDAHMGPNARNVDRWRALDQIVAENRSHSDLAAWLIPGDLNHGRMTIEDRNAWAERLRVMGGVAPVLICYGNHDLPGDLDVFAKLAAAWPIYVIARPEVLTFRLATGQIAAAFVLPYPTEAGLVSVGIAPCDIVQTARQALDAIFMDAAAQLDDARARGEIVLMVGHVNVAGSIVSTGQPNIGHEIEIDEALLTRLGDCYKGLNHIHKAQAVADFSAHYPGSICRLDWGEIDPKGYLEITYASKGWAGHGGDGPWASAGPHWDYDLRQRPLDVPPMYHVEGWLSRDGFTFEVKNGPDGAALEKPISWKGCEVRVRAKYHQSEKNMLEMAKAHIFAEFADAAKFELEPIAVPDTALRAPEVAAARTLAEKVQAWANETKTSLPADVMAALPALEHGDPDHIIASERFTMDALLVKESVQDESEVAVA